MQFCFQFLDNIEIIMIKKYCLKLIRNKQCKQCLWQVLVPCTTSQKVLSGHISCDAICISFSQVSFKDCGSWIYYHILLPYFWLLQRKFRFATKQFVFVPSNFQHLLISFVVLFYFWTSCRPIIYYNIKTIRYFFFELHTVFEKAPNSSVEFYLKL